MITRTVPPELSLLLAGKSKTIVLWEQSDLGILCLHMLFLSGSHRVGGVILDMVVVLKVVIWIITDDLIR